MDLRLQGAAVVVTGASRGIGAALALAFADEGAKVGICARDRGRLDAVAEQIRSRGAECLALAGDLTDADFCRDVVDRTAAAFGRLDVLVNNASAQVDNSPDTLEAATDADVTARFNGKTMPAIRCTRAALPHMRRAGGGRILFMGGGATRAVPHDIAQSGAGAGFAQGIGNAAIANFAKFLAEAVAKENILVNVIHPNRVRTERFTSRFETAAKQLGITEAEAESQFAASIPIGRMVRGTDIAPIVLLLSSPLNGAITGQAIAVDGGAMRNVQY